MPAEHLLRRLKSGAPAWCVIEPIAQGANVLSAHVQHNCLRRQVASDALVGVLDGSFLPRRLRIAEPGCRSHALFQFTPRDEFQASIECQALAGLRGQGCQMRDQLAHDRFRPPVVVAKQNGVAARTLDDGRDIGSAMFLAEDHQICFLLTELAA